MLIRRTVIQNMRRGRWSISAFDDVGAGGGALAERGEGGGGRSPQRTQATEGMGRAARASLACGVRILKMQSA